MGNNLGIQIPNMETSMTYKVLTLKMVWKQVQGRDLDSMLSTYRQIWKTQLSKLVERHAGEFKRNYIYLGPLKDGFLRGCRRVIVLDGCFLKTEHGRQLLTAVGVDGNNGMYPLLCVVVDVENRENWRWFLGLLKDDLHMNNSHSWTFNSDKQKGLVNAIESLFKHNEHRTCV
ncbi:Uncharacterized protein Adt_13379 [Abeliophyllum distichum]|uniref:MULE transposase domain-containing protein n=1 Tax=Abeliophyllum distichum TaxID=126358 RepID=A0ABD1TWN7_9LAMI